jgi:hypothetical protein
LNGYDAEIAPWLNLTLGNNVYVVSGNDTVTDEVYPACFPDLNGQVFLRGHVTLYPVPAIGGSLLAILPLDPDGNCSCTPEEKNVIATTTALAYIRDQPNIADVCMVRLLIDDEVLADVNLDNIVDGLDVELVENSTYFQLDPTAPSECPVEGCGREDVNKDGKVDQLDSTSITQSAILGTNVTCGGIYATAFSCGSTRKAPLTPAVSISLDTISYFSDDGLIVEGKLLQHQFATRSVPDTSLIDNILVEFDGIQSEVLELKESNKRLEDSLEESKKHIDNLEEAKKQSEKRDEAQDKRDEAHDEQLNSFSKNVRSNDHSVMFDVFLSIFVVLVCGVLVVALQKRRS